MKKWMLLLALPLLAGCATWKAPDSISESVDVLCMTTNRVTGIVLNVTYPAAITYRPSTNQTAASRLALNGLSADLIAQLVEAGFTFAGDIVETNADIRRSMVDYRYEIWLVNQDVDAVDLSGLLESMKIPIDAANSR